MGLRTENLPKKEHKDETIKNQEYPPRLTIEQTITNYNASLTSFNTSWIVTEKQTFLSLVRYTHSNIFSFFHINLYFFTLFVN